MSSQIPKNKKYYNFGKLTLRWKNPIADHRILLERSGGSSIALTKKNSEYTFENWNLGKSPWFTVRIDEGWPAGENPILDFRYRSSRSGPVITDDQLRMRSHFVGLQIKGEIAPNCEVRFFAAAPRASQDMKVNAVQLMLDNLAPDFDQSAQDALEGMLEDDATKLKWKPDTFSSENANLPPDPPFYIKRTADYKTGELAEAYDYFKVRVPQIASQTSKSAFYFHWDNPKTAMKQVWVVAFFLRRNNKPPKEFARWYWIKDRGNIPGIIIAKPFMFRSAPAYRRMNKSVDRKLNKLLTK